MAVTMFASETFPRGGTRTVQISFTDEAGVALTPNADTIKWTLTNKVSFSDTPTIINAREKISVTSDSTVYITMDSDDLEFLDDEEGIAFRVLTIEYEYDGLYGSNLKDKFQYIFALDDLIYSE